MTKEGYVWHEDGDANQNTERIGPGRNEVGTKTGGISIDLPHTMACKPETWIRSICLDGLDTEKNKNPDATPSQRSFSKSTSDMLMPCSIHSRVSSENASFEENVTNAWQR